MAQVLIDYFGTRRIVTPDPVVADGKVIISRFCAGQRVAPEKIQSEDTAIIGVSSVGYTPYVLPGGIPTALKDLSTRILETV